MIQADTFKIPWMSISITFLLGFRKAMPKLDLVYCREKGIFGVKFALKRETLLNGMISQFVAFTGKP